MRPISGCSLRICIVVLTFFTLCVTTSCQSTKSASPVNAGPSVLEMEPIPRTPERLARGKYLVEGIAQCFHCHSEVDNKHRGGLPIPGEKGGGHVFPTEEALLPAPYRAVAPNISPDPEYGAGKWKDSDFVRALRRGIGHDGRVLFPLMPYQYFRNLSDEDLASIIVYIRSIPPVHIERPKTVLPEQLKQVLQPLPPVEHAAEPDRADRVKYGEYLVTVGHCDGCHTPIDEKMNPLPGMAFAGGQLLIGRWGPDISKIQTVASLNLTPDPSGLSYMDERMFIETIRTGRVKARLLSNIMPWGYIRNLNDVDLKAVFAYLRTLKPVKHRVDNTDPPTFCKLGHRKHGLGSLNYEELPAVAASNPTRPQPH
jgi:mono/diheme cytochrome c family protein